MLFNTSQRSSSTPARRLCNRGFGVDTEGVAEGVANFAQGGVGLHRVVKKGHEIFVAGSGFSQCAKAALRFVVAALGAKLFEPLGLMARDRLVDLQNFDRFFF